MPNVTAIDFTPHMVLVEYSKNINGQEYPVRCYIPRASVPHIHLKGRPALIPRKLLARGMNYSDVDLTRVLGESFGEGIPTQQLQAELARQGLWMREDYKANPQVVTTVLTFNKWRKYLDTTTVLNAALREVFEGDN